MTPAMRIKNAVRWLETAEARFDAELKKSPLGKRHNARYRMNLDTPRVRAARRFYAAMSAKHSRAWNTI